MIESAVTAAEDEDAALAEDATLDEPELAAALAAADDADEAAPLLSPHAARAAALNVAAPAMPAIFKKFLLVIMRFTFLPYALQKRFHARAEDGPRNRTRRR